VLLPVDTAIDRTAMADRLLISAARAASLKLANQREAARPHMPVLVRAAGRFDLDFALQVADPVCDLTAPLKGPFKALELKWHAEASAALEAARIAGILPAFLVDPDHNPIEAQPFLPADLAALADPAALQLVTRARLPIAAHEVAEIVAFRKPDDPREHVALILGEQQEEVVPLVRLHSECLTGDVLGSLRCDCGPQLDGALDLLANEARRGGWGVLLYLRQEGRGIGLVNKLRAYRLQEQGYDTMEANERLGLPDEARDFETAARMLELLHIQRIRLLTNNPGKPAALAEAGIETLETVPHLQGASPHNTRYLATKRDRAGHLLP
jgi:GTP cyclohydrolase II